MLDQKIWVQCVNKVWPYGPAPPPLQLKGKEYRPLCAKCLVQLACSYLNRYGKVRGGLRVGLLV